MSGLRIAVLGAGIMGCCLALGIARRGGRVALFDRTPEPLRGASRWNEGKIHLGYLYGSDASLGTARRVIPGGLLFARALATLAGCDARLAMTGSDDVMLIHRDSVVDAATAEGRYKALDALVRRHPDAADYLADVSDARTRRLTKPELAAISDAPEIVAGFASPERSVDTRWVADRIVEAVRAEPLIEFIGGAEIDSVLPDDRGGMRVMGGAVPAERFAAVANALWEGRLMVDRSVGLEPEAPWSHRYRLALFVRTARPVPAGCAVISVGPFGDLKSYGDCRFYLSWYPAGLMAQGCEVAPPAPPTLDQAAERELVAAVRDHLGALLPGARAVIDTAAEIKVRGGYVFAFGQGSIGDPSSTLHRRDRFGVRRTGAYWSIDTGKYSTAPQMALDLAAEIVPA